MVLWGWEWGGGSGLWEGVVLWGWEWGGGSGLNEGWQLYISSISESQ